MNKTSIISRLSWYDLLELKNNILNYLYTDTLVKNLVLQEAIEPGRDFQVSTDYKLMCLTQSKYEGMDLNTFLRENNLWIENHPDFMHTDDLCKITGINCYGLVDCYKKNICVIG